MNPTRFENMQQFTGKLKTRSEVKVTLTQGWFVTLHHPKMHAQTKFGIPTSNNIRDMLRTYIFSKLGQS